MKNIIKMAAIGITALGIAGSAFALGPVLTISPSTIGTLTSVNSTVTLTLSVSGLNGNPDNTGPALGGFELVLDYDPTVLTLVSDSFGSAVTTGTGLWVDPVSANNADTQIDLSSGSPTESSANVIVSPGSIPGIVDLQDYSGDTASQLLAGQAKSFELASLTFQAVGTGSSQVAWDLSNTSLSDQSGAGSVAFTTAQSGVTVNSTVPEPGTCAMFSVGALLVLASGRRFVRAA